MAGNMESLLYERKLQDMKKYIPFLLNLMEQIKNNNEKNRDAQLKKMQALYTLLVNKNKRLNLNNLLKCEGILKKLQLKVEPTQKSEESLDSNPLDKVDSPDMSAPASPQSSDKNFVSRSPILIPTERKDSPKPFEKRDNNDKYDRNRNFDRFDRSNTSNNNNRDSRSDLYKRRSPPPASSRYQRFSNDPNSSGYHDKKSARWENSNRYSDTSKIFDRRYSPTFDDVRENKKLDYSPFEDDRKDRNKSLSDQNIFDKSMLNVTKSVDEEENWDDDDDIPSKISSVQAYPVTTKHGHSQDGQFNNNRHISPDNKGSKDSTIFSRLGGKLDVTKPGSYENFTLKIQNTSKKKPKPQTSPIAEVLKSPPLSANDIDDLMSESDQEKEKPKKPDKVKKIPNLEAVRKKLHNDMDHSKLKNRNDISFEPAPPSSNKPPHNAPFTQTSSSSSSTDNSQSDSNVRLAFKYNPHPRKSIDTKITEPDPLSDAKLAASKQKPQDPRINRPIISPLPGINLSDPRIRSRPMNYMMNNGPPMDINSGQPIPVAPLPVPNINMNATMVNPFIAGDGRRGMDMNMISPTNIPQDPRRNSLDFHANPFMGGDIRRGLDNNDPRRCMEGDIRRGMDNDHRRFMDADPRRGGDAIGSIFDPRRNVNIPNNPHLVADPRRGPVEPDLRRNMDMMAVDPRRNMDRMNTGCDNRRNIEIDFEPRGGVDARRKSDVNNYPFNQPTDPRRQSEPAFTSTSQRHGNNAWGGMGFNNNLPHPQQPPNPLNLNPMINQAPATNYPIPPVRKPQDNVDIGYKKFHPVLNDQVERMKYIESKRTKPEPKTYGEYRQARLEKTKKVVDNESSGKTVGSQDSKTTSPSAKTTAAPKATLTPSCLDAMYKKGDYNKEVHVTGFKIPKLNKSKDEGHSKKDGDEKKDTSDIFAKKKGKTTSDKPKDTKTDSKDKHKDKSTPVIDNNIRTEPTKIDVQDEEENWDDDLPAPVIPAPTKEFTTNSVKEPETEKINDKKDKSKTKKKKSIEATKMTDDKTAPTEEKPAVDLKDNKDEPKVVEAELEQQDKDLESKENGQENGITQKQNKTRHWFDLPESTSDGCQLSTQNIIFGKRRSKPVKQFETFTTEPPKINKRRKSVASSPAVNLEEPEFILPDPVPVLPAKQPSKRRKSTCVELNDLKEEKTTDIDDVKPPPRKVLNRRQTISVTPDDDSVIIINDNSDTDQPVTSRKLMQRRKSFCAASVACATAIDKLDDENETKTRKVTKRRKSVCKPKDNSDDESVILPIKRKAVDDGDDECKNDIKDDAQINAISSTTPGTIEEQSGPTTSIKVDTDIKSEKIDADIKKENCGTTSTTTTTKKEELTKEWLEGFLVNIFNSTIVNQSNVLTMLEKVLDEKKFLQIKQIVEETDDKTKNDDTADKTDETKYDETIIDKKDITGDDIKENELEEKIDSHKNKRHKTELDRLNEDIRDMFISQGVLTATGRRMCTIIKENKKEDELLSQTTTKKKQPIKKKVPEVAKSKVSKVTITKGPTGKVKILKKRGRKPKNYQPHLEETESVASTFNDNNIDNDDDYKNDETNVGEEEQQVEIEPYESKNDNTPYLEMPILEPYTPLISNATATEKSVQNSTKKKYKPCPKSKRKINRVSDDEDQVTEEEEEILSTEEVFQITVGNNTEDVTNDKDNIKKSTKARVSKVDTKALTENALINMKNINPEMHSKSMYINKCVICGFSGRYIANHYIQSHPTFEVLISRLPADVLQLIKNDQINNAFEVKKSSDNTHLLFKFKCPFCDLESCLTRKSWEHHFGIHTGEYTFKCSNCSKVHNSKQCMVQHVKKCGKGATLERIRDNIKINRQAREVVAYVCNLCNYIQMSKDTVIKHLNEQHEDDKNYDKDNIEKFYDQVTLLNCKKTAMSSQTSFNNLDDNDINDITNKDDDMLSSDQLQVFSSTDDNNLMNSYDLSYNNQSTVASTTPSASASTTSIADTLSQKFNDQTNNDEHNFDGMFQHSIFNDMSIVDRLSERFKTVEQDPEQTKDDKIVEPQPSTSGMSMADLLSKRFENVDKINENDDDVCVIENNDGCQLTKSPIEMEKLQENLNNDDTNNINNNPVPSVLYIVDKIDDQLANAEHIKEVEEITIPEKDDDEEMSLTSTDLCNDKQESTSITTLFNNTKTSTPEKDTLKDSSSKIKSPHLNRALSITERLSERLQKDSSTSIYNNLFNCDKTQPSTSASCLIDQSIAEKSGSSIDQQPMTQQSGSSIDQPTTQQSGSSIDQPTTQKSGSSIDQPTTQKSGSSIDQPTTQKSGSSIDQPIAKKTGLSLVERLSKRLNSCDYNSDNPLLSRSSSSTTSLPIKNLSEKVDTKENESKIKNSSSNSCTTLNTPDIIIIDSSDDESEPAEGCKIPIKKEVSITEETRTNNNNTKDNSEDIDSSSEGNLIIDENALELSNNNQQENINKDNITNSLTTTNNILEEDNNAENINQNIENNNCNDDNKEVVDDDDNNNDDDNDWEDIEILTDKCTETTNKKSTLKASKDKVKNAQMVYETLSKLYATIRPIKSKRDKSKKLKNIGKGQQKQQQQNIDDSISTGCHDETLSDSNIGTTSNLISDTETLSISDKTNVIDDKNNDIESSSLPDQIFNDENPLEECNTSSNLNLEDNTEKSSSLSEDQVITENVIPATNTNEDQNAVVNTSSSNIQNNEEQQSATESTTTITLNENQSSSTLDNLNNNQNQPEITNSFQSTSIETAIPSTIFSDNQNDNSMNTYRNQQLDEISGLLGFDPEVSPLDQIDISPYTQQTIGVPLSLSLDINSINPTIFVLSEQTNVQDALGLINVLDKSGESLQSDNNQSQLQTTCNEGELTTKNQNNSSTIVNTETSSTTEPISSSQSSSNDNQNKGIDGIEDNGLNTLINTPASNSNPPIHRIDNLGYSKTGLNTIKYHCLVESCSFLYSSLPVGLETHFMMEHKNVKWQGFCCSCESQTSDLENMPLSKELEHMQEVHLNITSITDKKLINPSDKPLIKIRRFSGDTLSAKAEHNNTSPKRLSSEEGSTKDLVQLEDKNLDNNDEKTEQQQKPIIIHNKIFEEEKCPPLLHFTSTSAKVSIKAKSITNGNTGNDAMLKQYLIRNPLYEYVQENVPELEGIIVPQIKSTKTYSNKNNKQESNQSIIINNPLSSPNDLRISAVTHAGDKTSTTSKKNDNQPFLKISEVVSLFKKAPTTETQSNTGVSLLKKPPTTETQSNTGVSLLKKTPTTETQSNTGVSLLKKAPTTVTQSNIGIKISDVVSINPKSSKTQISDEIDSINATDSSTSSTLSSSTIVPQSIETIPEISNVFSIGNTSITPKKSNLATTGQVKTLTIQKPQMCSVTTIPSDNTSVSTLTSTVPQISSVISTSNSNSNSSSSSGGIINTNNSLRVLLATSSLPPNGPVQSKPGILQVCTSQSLPSTSTSMNSPSWAKLSSSSPVPSSSGRLPTKPGSLKNIKDLFNYIGDLEKGKRLFKVVGPTILKPWTFSTSIKSHFVVKTLLDEKCLFSLYKCMGSECTYYTNYMPKMAAHLTLHTDVLGATQPDNGTKYSWRECCYCSDRFSTNSTLLAHIQGVHSKDIYQCSYCFYRSCVGHNVVVHISTFHKDKDMSILLCSGEQRKLSNEIRHLAARRAQNVLPIPCHKCRRSFYILRNYIKHIEQEHGSEFIDYTCDICYKNIPKGDIEKHLVIKHHIGIYECIYCLFATVTMDLMRIHMSNTHPSYLSYMCVRLSPNKNVEVEIETLESSTVLANLAEPVDEKYIKRCPYTSLQMSSKDYSLEESILIPHGNVSPEYSPSSSPLHSSSTSVQPIAAPSKAVLPQTSKQSGSDLTIASVQSISNEAFEKLDGGNSNITDKVLPTQPPGPPPLSVAMLDYIKPVPSKEQTERDLITKMHDRILEAANEMVSGTGVPEKDLYKCAIPGCNYKYTKVPDFFLHVSEHAEQSKLREIKCYHCTQSFKTALSLKAHLKTHAMHRYFCSFCNYTGAQSYNVMKHIIWTHSKGAIVTQPLIRTQINKNRDFFVLCPKKGTQQDVIQFGERLARAVERKKSLNKKYFEPDEIDMLPRQAIFYDEVFCKICDYRTKVRTNMYRHLQFHKQEVNVASVDPVNPVPCLNKPERHFDRMQNLACSSNSGKDFSGKTKDEPEIPEYIPASKRFVCGVSGCTYLNISESMLKCHLTALHSDEKSYICPHCSVEICKKTFCADKILSHLKCHDVKLFVCGTCFYTHHQKHIVERHISEKHQGTSTIMSYERNGTDTIKTTEQITKNNKESTNSIVPPLQPAGSDMKWECGLCKAKRPTYNQMVCHMNRTHEVKNRYQCIHCDFGGAQIKSIVVHIAEKHPTKVKEARCMFYKVNENPSEIQQQDNITPIWTRDANRVKNIRGILMEDEEESQRNLSINDSSYVDDDDEELIDNNQSEVPVTENVESIDDIQKTKNTNSKLNTNFNCNQCSFYGRTALEIKHHKATFDHKNIIIDDVDDLYAFFCFHCMYKVSLNDLLEHWKNCHSSDSNNDELTKRQIPFWFKIAPQVACGHCQFKSVTVNVRRHHNLVHGNLNIALRNVRNLNKCSQCPFVFDTIKNLMIHFKANHPNPTEPNIAINDTFLNKLLKHGYSYKYVKCLYCKEIPFGLESYMEHHNKKHPNEKILYEFIQGQLLYLCSQCIFLSDEETTIRHMYTHDFNCNYKCQTCSMKFESFPKFLTHLKDDHNSKPTQSTINVCMNNKMKQLNEVKVVLPNGLVIPKALLGQTKFATSDIIKKLVEKEYSDYINDITESDNAYQSEIESISSIKTDSSKTKSKKRSISSDSNKLQNSKRPCNTEKVRLPSPLTTTNTDSSDNKLSIKKFEKPDLSKIFTKMTIGGRDVPISCESFAKLVKINVRVRVKRERLDLDLKTGEFVIPMKKSILKKKDIKSNKKLKKN